MAFDTDFIRKLVTDIGADNPSAEGSQDLNGDAIVLVNYETSGDVVSVEPYEKCTIPFLLQAGPLLMMLCDELDRLRGEKA